MDEKLQISRPVATGWALVALAGLWILTGGGAQLRAWAEPSAEEKAHRAAAFDRCEQQVTPEVTKRMASMPQSPQRACREWLEQFVRGGLRDRCMFDAGAADVTALQVDCWPLRQLHEHCAPTDWPSDALDPGIQAVCRLG